MARNCGIYIDNGGKCSPYNRENNSSIPNSGLITQANPLDESTKCKIFSDQTGNKNGKGINKYIDSEAFCSTLQTKLKVRTRTVNGSEFYYSIFFNKNLVSEIQAIFEEIYTKTNFRVEKLVAYRKQSKVDNHNSYHMYGVAIDLNPTQNPYTYTYDGHIDDDMYIRTENHPVVQIFYKYGWHWGGIWNKHDYMHFCYVYG